jgi:hypothetical protein
MEGCMTFSRKTYKRERVYPTPIPAHLRSTATLARADGFTATVEKEGLIQSAAYMNLVRAMPCAHCGAPTRSEFCHSDMGKGTGIKSDCREGWPGCHACHDAIGTRRIYPRLKRRELEATMARQTREKIEAAGLWPANLPKWSEK